jgi:hypothetical protein
MKQMGQTLGGVIQPGSFDPCGDWDCDCLASHVVHQQYSLGLLFGWSDCLKGQKNGIFSGA